MNSSETLKAYQADRFGLFLHFGAYAVNGQSEWLKTYNKMSDQAYQAYIGAFQPEADCMSDWARSAKAAGVKYAVLTTKHHDGFCLFDSQLTDYTTKQTIDRDLVAEFVQAFRAQGIKIGFYYSLLDWHHFDFPHYADLHHPQNQDLQAKADEPKRDWSRYLSYLQGQVRELLTKYGPIDLFWYDFSYENADEAAVFKAMRGETWGGAELVKIMRELQPQMIFNNRLAGEEGLLVAEPAEFAGDFTSPEQLIPPQGLLNEAGQQVPWEACVTMNEAWGYSRQTGSYKSSKTLIHALVDVVSKSGNLLSNIGPNALGHFPEQAQERLAELGKWLKTNQDSIYGCGAAPFAKPEWGRYTYKPAQENQPAKLYAHLYERGVGPLPLLGLEGKIQSARLLYDGTLLDLKRPWNVVKFPDDAFIDLPWAELPDDLDTVIELILK